MHLAPIPNSPDRNKPGGNPPFFFFSSTLPLLQRSMSPSDPQPPCRQKEILACHCDHDQNDHDDYLLLTTFAIPSHLSLLQCCEVPIISLMRADFHSRSGRISHFHFQGLICWEKKCGNNNKTVKNEYRKRQRERTCSWGPSVLGAGPPCR